MKVVQVISMLLLVLICEADSQPLNEILTNQAWEALNNKQYNFAIEKAQECISEFGPTALKIQKQLEQKGEIIPDGDVTNEEKIKIFNNGLLNDVAACLFIKARALEEKKQKTESLNVYKILLNFSYARVWDPKQKLFWSPSTSAKDKLSKAQTQSTEKAGIGQNEILTNAAWEAYEQKKYELAINKATECIDNFELIAIKLQSELIENKIPVPKTGPVNGNEREGILKNGLLNDVATCWFIKARSLEEIKKKEEAIIAYQKAMEYPHARTWDPSQKIFWSPALAATDRIDFIKL